MILRQPSGDTRPGLALDAGALGNLKREARTAPQQALKAAASQFEALFLQQLMKSMRQALPQDGPLSSDTSRTYTEMLDAQLAQTLAKKGTGIADMLVKQLSHTVGGAAKAATPVAPIALPVPKLSQQPLRPVLPHAAAAGGALAGAVASVGHFIDKMRPYAETAAQAMGVPVHYLLAQAALETGWGKSQPRSADGAPSHNLFGIKAGRHWKGAVVEASTTEYVAGKAVRTVERFRAYPSPHEAFQDFAALLSRNGRYAGVLRSANAEAYAAQMQRSGYATDPAYADKLARVIQTVARHAGAQRPVAAQLPAAIVDNHSTSV